MYDLLLKNAWVVDPLNSVNGIADVAIQDGKIAKVQRDISEEAKEVIDFTGKTLQPGIIDSNVGLSLWPENAGNERCHDLSGHGRSSGQHPRQRS